MAAPSQTLSPAAREQAWARLWERLLSEPPAEAGTAAPPPIATPADDDPDGEPLAPPDEQAA